ncbi:liver-expressed antimicrobial peptide 2-like [Erpetoichthys calabaricus]|uniref:liver-expressed antimicrobial peptide 2-like n=1 Tax=Erpetoichthys calabaricus TaxID=27687 RepID=UPI00109F9146|nr:liver-expressed antimicrobial peptide 2-like [Erpetoichthys calabaricus]
MHTETITFQIVVVCIALLMVSHQISSIPIQSQLSKSRSESLKVLHRMARMTPLWRSMGSKPHGAYCHDHHECSTKMCSNGHCSLSQPHKL